VELGQPNIEDLCMDGYVLLFHKLDMLLFFFFFLEKKKLINRSFARLRLLRAHAR
jgi:hypothetical protein